MEHGILKIKNVDMANTKEETNDSYNQSAIKWDKYLTNSYCLELKV